MTATVRLMLVDDHPLVRDGLRMRLTTVPGFEVVAEAEDPAGALAALTAQQPDVALMDIAMREGSGIDLVREFHERAPQVQVIMLTMHDQPQYVLEAFRNGARGYVLKDCPAQEIVTAISAVMGGRRYCSAGVAEALAAGSTPASLLTQREKEVLGLIAEGLSSKEIATRLALSVRTVETHRLNIKRKCDLEGSSALVKFAVERSWARL